jgi:hypothetical protein
MRKLTTIFICVLLCAGVVIAQQAQPTANPAVGAGSPAKDSGESIVIPKDAKVFVAPMPDKFDDYIKAAIQAKHVPVTVVESKDQADFEISGYSESQKASTAKKIIMGSWHSRESASIKVANIKSGVIAFAYSYNTDNSTHGKKSSAEACAKHLKEKIDSQK